MSQVTIELHEGTVDALLERVEKELDGRMAATLPVRQARLRSAIRDNPDRQAQAEILPSRRVAQQRAHHGGAT